MRRLDRRLRVGDIFFAAFELLAGPKIGTRDGRLSFLHRC